MKIEPRRLLIDGELVAAASGREHDNINPATEEVLGRTSDAGTDDVQRAIAAARRTIDGGSWASDPDFRAHCLTQLQDQLSWEVGRQPGSAHCRGVMPVGLARALAVDPSVEGLSYDDQEADIHRRRIAVGGQC